MKERISYDNGHPIPVITSALRLSNPQRSPSYTPSIGVPPMLDSKAISDSRSPRGTAPLAALDRCPHQIKIYGSGTCLDDSAQRLETPVGGLNISRATAHIPRASPGKYTRVTHKRAGDSADLRAERPRHATTSDRTCVRVETPDSAPVSRGTERVVRAAQRTH